MLDLDLTSTSIAVGLIVSLGFTELFGLAAGGMVVPGYLALSMDHPADVAVTLVVALLTFAVVAAISKFTMIYGRRRTVMMILVGFTIGAMVRIAPLQASAGAPGPTAGVPGLHVVGYIIPGLIALWMQRQGVVQTLCILATTTVVVRLVLILIGMEVPA